METSIALKTPGRRLKKGKRTSADRLQHMAELAYELRCVAQSKRIIKKILRAAKTAKQFKVLKLCIVGLQLCEFEIGRLRRGRHTNNGAQNSRSEVLEKVLHEYMEVEAEKFGLNFHGVYPLHSFCILAEKCVTPHHPSLSELVEILHDRRPCKIQ